MKKSINLILVAALFIMGGCAGELPLEVGDIKIIDAPVVEEVKTAPETVEATVASDEGEVVDAPNVQELCENKSGCHWVSQGFCLCDDVDRGTDSDDENVQDDNGDENQDEAAPICFLATENRDIAQGTEFKVIFTALNSNKGEIHVLWNEGGEIVSLADKRILSFENIPAYGVEVTLNAPLSVGMASMSAFTENESGDKSLCNLDINVTEGFSYLMREIPATTVTMIGTVNLEENESPWPQQFSHEQSRVTSVRSWAEVVYASGNNANGSGFVKAYNRIEAGTLEGLNSHWEQTIEGSNVKVTGSYARSSQLYVTSHDQSECVSGRRVAGRSKLHHYDGQYLARPDHPGLTNSGWNVDLGNIRVGDSGGIMASGTAYFEVTPLDVAVSREAIYVVGEARIIRNDNTVGCDSETYADAAVLKYDFNGNRQGFKRYNRVRSALTAVDVAPNGTVYVAGWAEGRVARSDGDSHQGAKDIFVMHLSQRLEGIRAVRQYGTELDDVVTDLVAVDNLNFYVVGHTRGELDRNGYGKFENDRDAFLMHFQIDPDLSTRNFYSMDTHDIVQFFREGDQSASGVDYSVDAGLVIAGHTHGAFTRDGLYGQNHDAFLVTYRDVSNLRQNFGVIQLGTESTEKVTGVCLSADSYLIAGYTRGNFINPDSRVLSDKGVILRVKQDGLVPVGINENHYVR